MEQKFIDVTLENIEKVKNSNIEKDKKIFLLKHIQSKIAEYGNNLTTIIGLDTIIKAEINIIEKYTI